MISKELLSEVLELRSYIESIDESVDEKNIYYYSSYESYPATQYSINIYELSHKCKEWAISKGWVLHEVRNLKEYIIYFSGDFREPSNDFRADTEHEAIFQACEWILKEHHATN